MKHYVKTMALVAASMCVLPAAQAQSAGTWLIKFGANQIAPDVQSGDLTAPSAPGSRVDVKADIEAIGSFAYMYSDHVSFEGYFGMPYKHDVMGAGAMADVGRIGQVRGRLLEGCM